MIDHQIRTCSFGPTTCESRVVGPPEGIKTIATPFLNNCGFAITNDELSGTDFLRDQQYCARIRLKKIVFVAGDGYIATSRKITKMFHRPYEIAQTTKQRTGYGK